MGQQISKENQEYLIPNQKKIKLSYVVHETIKTKSEILESVDLSNILGTSKVSIIMQFLYYKFKIEGYSLTPLKIEFPCFSIFNILNEINVKGIAVLNNTELNDFKISKKCYKPKLNNIYHFLNKGIILLGLIILNEKFMSNILQIDTSDYNDNNIISDVILIVGYDKENIFIKSSWCKENIKVKNEYIDNIKEIWDVELKTFY
jgi:hypothetical protein